MRAAGRTCMDEVTQARPGRVDETGSNEWTGAAKSAIIERRKINVKGKKCNV